jgi:hypothetical protein
MCVCSWGDENGDEDPQVLRFFSFLVQPQIIFDH